MRVPIYQKMKELSHFWSFWCSLFGARSQLAIILVFYFSCASSDFYYLFFLDDSTFKDILRFIGEQQLLKVKAILWCILPNVRRDALLTKQARLIEMFKPR